MCEAPHILWPFLIRHLHAFTLAECLEHKSTCINHYLDLVWRCHVPSSFFFSITSTCKIIVKMWRKKYILMPLKELLSSRYACKCYMPSQHQFSLPTASKDGWELLVASTPITNLFTIIFNPRLISNVCSGV